MKSLAQHTIDANNARAQWHEYRTLLTSKSELGETADIQPFFYNRYDLSAMCAYYFPDVRSIDRIAHEFDISGNFIADMIVGDYARGKYLLIEFEDGKPNSIFNKTPKASPDWAKRFEGAFSQVLDWIWKLEDMRSTAAFQHTFGTREASFQALIVIGKNMNLSQQEESRLKWRVEKTMVDSKPISVVSLDSLAEDIDYYLTEYRRV